MGVGLPLPRQGTLIYETQPITTFFWSLFFCGPRKVFKSGYPIESSHVPQIHSVCFQPLFSHLPEGEKGEKAETDCPRNPLGCEPSPCLLKKDGST